MKYTLEQFTNLIEKTSSWAEAKDLIAKIIIEASQDPELVQEALMYVNMKLDWAAAIERTIQHPELN